VLPHVQYELACLLIRYAIGCVYYSVEWGMGFILCVIYVTYFVIYLSHTVQEETLMGKDFDGESLTLQAGPLMGNP
jgi:hypothetical protein